MRTPFILGLSLSTNGFQCVDYSLSVLILLLKIGVQVPL